MARSGMRTYPAHGPRCGRGARIDDASGFLRPAHDVVRDVRQGLVSRDTADLTPGFGTMHPQDARRPPSTDDPRSIRDARPDDNTMALSARDLGYTDAEVRAAVRAGLPLRQRARPLPDPGD